MRVSPCWWLKVLLARLSKQHVDRQTCTVQREVPGDHSNSGPSPSQAADLVVLDAAVHHCDAQTPAGVEDPRLLGGGERVRVSESVKELRANERE